MWWKFYWFMNPKLSRHSTAWCLEIGIWGLSWTVKKNTASQLRYLCENCRKLSSICLFLLSVLFFYCLRKKTKPVIRKDKYFGCLQNVSESFYFYVKQSHVSRAQIWTVIYRWEIYKNFLRSFLNLKNMQNNFN